MSLRIGFELSCRPCAFALSIALLSGLDFAYADQPNVIDTESLFGFLIGSDVNDPGERELELETSAALGKGAGSYSALQQRFSFEYTPIDDLRSELSAAVDRHAVSNVPGFEDVQHGSLQSLSFELRYRLLDREKGGFGVTLRAEPSWGFVDDVSGLPADQYSSPIGLLMDREIVTGSVAAFNISYEPQWTKLRGDNTWGRQASVALGTGLMSRIGENLFVGPELRYVRSYDALDLQFFSGDAVFLGPALFYRPSEDWRITAAWSSQLVGHVSGIATRLDLRDFVKYEFKFRVGRTF